MYMCNVQCSCVEGGNFYMKFTRKGVTYKVKKKKREILAKILLYSSTLKKIYDVKIITCIYVADKKQNGMIRSEL